MAADLSLGVKDLERILMASLLRRGMDPEVAARTGRDLAEDLHREFRGKRVNVRVERECFRVLTDSDRRRIFLRWWTDREEDHVLCTTEVISRTTLQRIKDRGKRLHWAK